MPLAPGSKLGPYEIVGRLGAADGKALLHNSALNDRANIWLQPIAGGAPRKVTNFADQVILAFDRTPDGKRLIIARGTLNRDAVMIKNFR